MSQLFGMDFTTLAKRAEQASNKKTENAKNTIGKPEISKEASEYYEKLKEKFGDVEFVLVEDEQMGDAKRLSNNVRTEKELIVMISESELEAMAKDEATRNKNEQLIADAVTQMPGMKEELKKTGAEAESFGMEFNGDGTVTYFVLADKLITASSFEELMKKMQDAAYEEKTNSVMTDKEKMVGQHFDMKF